MGNTVEKTSPRLDQTQTDQDLSDRQKTKLKVLLEEVVTKVSIDYSNQEIQDIQSAVRKMLQRVVECINERGIFRISRIQPCGSMAEKTSSWKYDVKTDKMYLEFDFLAVLDKSLELGCGLNCAGCIKIDDLPVDNQTFIESYDKTEIFCMENLTDKIACDTLFWKEVQLSLASSCKCISLDFDNDDPWERVSYNITSEKPAFCENGCDSCVIEMPTGVLRVNDSVSIDRSVVTATAANCSLVLQWTSKVKSLVVFDRMAKKSQQIDTLSIYLDFLPALELLTEMNHEHFCFVVPKRCGICNRKNGWRLSNCVPENAYIVHKMSEKHRTCFKIIKYLLAFVDDQD